MSTTTPYEISGFSTESDVEQKFIFPFLTAPYPIGLGYPAESVITKQSIKRLQIGKGKDIKLYYPDYLLLTGGYPVAIVEAKAPGENLENALRESRLYAHEINALLANYNPVSIVIVANGDRIRVAKWDEAVPLYDIAISDCTLGNITHAEIVELCCFEALTRKLEQEYNKKKKPYYVATRLLGGQYVLEEALPPNTFGSTIALEYRDIFNPTSMHDRKEVVLHGYVPSQRRERIVDPIDRIIRASAPISLTEATLITDTENSTEIINKLRSNKSSSNQVILVVGGPGSGKTTFIDYLREVRLPKDLRDSTHWVNINLNNAPLSTDEIYEWTCRQLVANLEGSRPDIDFADLEIIEKIFYVELNKAKRGELRLLEGDSHAYNAELYRLIRSLRENTSDYAKRLARFICSGTEKRLIIVFDNCDKRIRDDQLLMFQVAQWLNSEFGCLIILPLREETYENHRDQPPLDTAVKDLVFRFQPPQFQEVLAKRIRMALKAINPERQYSYTTSKGMRVIYDGKDQEAYLNCILRSLYEHDRLVRRLITGLAGRNLRKALELFLEFCKSGHIQEEVFFKIRQNDGDYVLPLHIVTRAFLYGNRKYYKSDASYLKNILSLNQADINPSYFTRFAILKWLEAHLSIKGPTGMQGFHKTSSMVDDLVLAGYHSVAVFRETEYLVASNCIISESLRTDQLSIDDLVRLSPAGFVHLTLLNSPHYYAAIAEEIPFEAESSAIRVSESIGSYQHFSRQATASNAREVLTLLESTANGRKSPTHGILEDGAVSSYYDGTEILQWCRKAIDGFDSPDPWSSEVKKYRVGDEVDGIIEHVMDIGFIVSFGSNLDGLLHRDHVPPEEWQSLSERDTAILKVRIARINFAKHRISLDFVNTIMI